MTLYLKYRPQTVSQLDLAAVRETLGKTLTGKELPHAWLFSGPRGTGKTSAARILAKYLSCTAKKDRPCGECEICRAVADGRAPDVVEIDAASNRGIDEIRTLREQVGLAPMSGKFKVYIIDEAHMLTMEAANALLKTLEEPPAHVVFVLCTTDSGKLPETVVSRCAVVTFGRPTAEEITAKLERVAKSEGMKIKVDDLKKIASAARGSFRDAIKTLEQVALGGGDVEKVLGDLGGDDAELFVGLVRAGQTKEALKTINRLSDRGVNLRGFVEECVERLRVELLETLDKGLVGLIEGLEKAYVAMKDTAVPALPLEIFVVENTPKGSGDKHQRVEVPIAQVKKKTETQEAQFEDVDQELPEAGKYKVDDLSGRWVDVIKAVRPMNHSVEALLRSTRPVGFDGRDVVLEAFYEFHKKQLETERCRVIVEKAVGEVFGVRGVSVKFRLGEGPTRVVKKADSPDERDELVKAAEEIFKQ